MVTFELRPQEPALEVKKKDGCSRKREQQVSRSRVEKELGKGPLIMRLAENHMNLGFSPG